MKKKMLVIPVVLLMIVSLLACAAPTPAPAPAPAPAPTPAPVPKAEVIKWKAQTTYTMESAVTLHLKMWAEAMDKLSGGRLKVEIFPPNTFSPAGELARSVGKGVMDVGHTYPGFHIGLIPEADPESGLPGGWMSHAEVWEMHYERGMLEIMRDAYAEHNIFYLGPSFADQYYHFATTFPVTSIDDIKGKKIRATGAYGKYAAALGASVTVIPGPEMYMAMKLGTIDGAIYGMSGQWDIKLAEVTKTYVFPTAGIPVTTTLLNMDSFNALPDDLKLMVREASRYAFADSAYAYYQFDERAWVFAQELGVKKYQMTHEEILNMVKISQPIWDDVAAKSPRNAQIVELLREMLRDYGRL